MSNPGEGQVTAEPITVTSRPDVQTIRVATEPETPTTDAAVPAAEPPIQAEGEKTPEGDKPPETDEAKSAKAEAEPAKAEAEKKDSIAAAWDKMQRRAREQDARESRIREAETAMTRAYELLSAAKDDPWNFLASLGVTAEDVLANAAGSKKPPPTAEEQIAELRRELAERDRINARAQRDQENQQIIMSAHQNIKNLVKQAGDKYEMLAKTEQFDKVIDVMAAYHRKYKTLPDVVDAIDVVEKELEAIAETAASTKKFSGKFAAKSGRPTTLTNGAAAEIPVSQGGDDLPMDPEERTRAVLKKWGFSGQ
jgi:hypothetical protein